MKRLLTYLSILFAGLLSAACYKDLSTPATTTLPDIVISGLDQESYYVLYGHTLSLKAKVWEDGRDDSDFTYRWEMDLRPRSGTDRMLIGEDLTLEYKVGNTPSDHPYTLSFTARDEVTGIEAIRIMRVYVTSSLGEGLLVAHSRDGGATTEFDLVANSYVTYGFEGNTPRYTRDIYALANEEPFQGKVTALCARKTTNGAVYNESWITVGTPEHIINLETLTYKKALQDGDLFNMRNITDFGTTLICNGAGYQTMAVIGGEVYTDVSHTSNLFSKNGFPGEPANIFGPENVAVGGDPQSCYAAFDPNSGKFFSIIGPFAGQQGFSETVVTSDESLVGATPLAAGPSAMLVAILIRSASGRYHVYRFGPGGVFASSFSFTNEDLSQAKWFSFCENADVLYAASEDKIWSILLKDGGATVRQVTWSPDSPDEHITGIKHYRQAFWGTQQLWTGYSFTLPTHMLQVIITTYNEKTGEGKFYLRPYNVSTGLFTFKNNGVYDGFGEIYCIAPTFR